MADRPSIGIILQDFSLGGTERVAARLAQRWADLGCRVVIFCGSRSGGMSSLLGDGIEVVEARPAIRRSARSRTALARAAARHFGRHPVDICFIPGHFHWPVVRPIARLRGRRRPKIVVQVSAALRKAQSSPLKRLALDVRMRWLLRGADAIVSLSLIADKRPGRRSLLRTIPLPAIDDETPAPLPVPEGDPLILGIGRLVPEKGFATLIAAFALTANPAARLTIAGAGPEEARLRALAEAEGVAGRIDWPGVVADPRPLLDRARLFVLPARQEGHATALVEALAAGRMVVATDGTPAAAELLADPATGRVVPADDPAAMARAIDAILAVPATDPQALAATVGRFRIGPVAEAYLALFADLRGRR